MKNQILQTMWHLLDDVEDYCRFGYRNEHNDYTAILDCKAQKSEDSLSRVTLEIHNCKKCQLCTDRKKTVPGEGVSNPLLMLIGEAPGYEEDKTGRPFVGKAGRYLDKWLAAISLERQKDCFITNIIKCRPPDNRDPYPEEQEICFPYLLRQIGIIKPKIILTLGRIAGRKMTGQEVGITRLRGQIYQFNSTPLITTYHPSGVLRNPEYRAPVWEDLKKIRTLLDTDQ